MLARFFARASRIGLTKYSPVFTNTRSLINNNFNNIRFFSTGVTATNPHISIDDAVQSQKNILLTLKSEPMRAQLEGIKHSEADLVTKWQSTLGLLLPLQIQSIIIMGYNGDQEGMQKFQQDMDSLVNAGNGHFLREINDEKWAYLLDVVFDTVPGKKLTTQNARSLAADLSAAMQSESFLTQVDKAMQSMPEGSSANQKRQRLLQILIPLHIQVLGKHGFDGEAGYVQAQLSLMEHMADQVVSLNVMSATTTMFSRAGLI